VYFTGAQHAVFRVKWGENEKPAPFVGTPGTPGGGETGLRDPCAIAFDAKGTLYVADRGNHRVVAFDREGKLVGQVLVNWPRQLVVLPETGVLYVTSGFKQAELLKFRSMAASKPVAALHLQSPYPILALDTSSTPSALYVANMGLPEPGEGKQKELLVRLLDRGTSFQISKVLSADDPPRQPLLYGVDRERERVYGSWFVGEWWRMDGQTGEIERFDTLLSPKSNGITEIAAGAGGVLVHVKGELGRLDHALRPLPFPSLGTYIAEFDNEDAIRCYCGHGVCLAPDGDIYWIHERKGDAKPMRLSALNAEGTIKKDSLITFETGSPAGVRVDRQGNIYVIDHLKPLDQLIPEDLKGKAERRRLDLFMHHYGSLLKFRPTGGRVTLIDKAKARKIDLKPGQKQFTTAEGQANFVAEGVEWSYFGVSMIRPARLRAGCRCWTPRFDLDDYGRVFVPDELRCRILVLDANGNEIMSFGRYGNVDDHEPGVALADPRTVMVSRKAAYVGDMTNQRIMRVPLRSEARASCEVIIEGVPSPLSRALRKLRKEAVRKSPHLDANLDWIRLDRQLAGRSLDEARGLLCLACREVTDWPEKEMEALLGHYLRSRSEELRATVVWALWGKTTPGGTGQKLLRKALKDKSDLVCSAAALTLVYRDDPSGLPELFDGALSKNRHAYRLAETAILKKAIAYDPNDPRAYQVDDRQSIVPRYPTGPKEIDALVRILKATRPGPRRKSSLPWHLRRATIFMLGLSESNVAAEALFEELRTAPLTGNNLNCVIGALGILRHRPATPELVEFVKRGTAPNWRGGHADRAEVFAATALGRIAAPESVQPLIELLDSPTRGSAEQSLRALTAIFYPQYPPDGRLIPRGNELALVRIDRLPDMAARRRAWEGFWKTYGANAAWSEDGPPMRHTGGKVGP
jgi:HEAT repeat protein